MRFFSDWALLYAWAIAIGFIRSFFTYTFLFATMPVLCIFLFCGVFCGFSLFASVCFVCLLPTCLLLYLLQSEFFFSWAAGGGEKTLVPWPAVDIPPYRCVYTAFNVPVGCSGAGRGGGDKKGHRRRRVATTGADG